MKKVHASKPQGLCDGASVNAGIRASHSLCVWGKRVSKKLELIVQVAHVSNGQEALVAPCSNWAHKQAIAVRERDSCDVLGRSVARPRRTDWVCRVGSSPPAT